MLEELLCRVVDSEAGLHARSGGREDAGRQRGGSTEFGFGFEQQNGCAFFSCRHRSGETCSAATDDNDVPVFGHESSPVSAMMRW